MSCLQLSMLGELSDLALEDRCACLLLHDQEGFASALRTMDAMGISRGMNSHRLAWAVAFNINGVPASSANGHRTGRSAGGYRDRWPADSKWPAIWSEFVRPLAEDNSGHPRTRLSELALSVACEQREDWQNPEARPLDLDVADQAFQTVYETNQLKVLGTARALCRRYPKLADEPEAIANEAWANVFCNYWSVGARQRFHGLSSISTMVCKVAQNKVIDAIRKQARFVSNDEDLDARVPVSSKVNGQISDPTANVISEQLYRRAKECLSNLPAKQSVVAEMVWLRQMTANRVAQILGVSEPAISQHLSKARDVVRPCMKRHGFDLSG
jgi:RNA polymerase sigma factor (sigma-70 family)